MKNYLKKIELLANLAIIVVAVLLCVILVRSYLFSSFPTTNNSATYKSPTLTGSKINLPAINRGNSGDTLLLVLSTTCHFCTESMPFYQQLAKERGDVRMIAVLPQPIAAGTEYLKQHEVSVDEVTQSQLDTLNVNGTPTLLLIDKSGVVKNSWFGKLSPDQQSDVLNNLRLMASSR
jgi:thiol-disulfide isomerase/thioredoxin